MRCTDWRGAGGEGFDLRDGADVGVDLRGQLGGDYTTCPVRVAEKAGAGGVDERAWWRAFGEA